MLERKIKGRLPPDERMKLMLKMRMDKHNQERKRVTSTRVLSARAQEAVDQMEKKKKAKERKILEQMVVVKAQNFTNGRIGKDGKVYDIMGNLIASVNKKNGRISTGGGMGLGRYKAKSYMTSVTLMNAINQYSPYFIQQRKIQAMIAAGIDPQTGRPLNEAVIDVHGQSYTHSGGGAAAAMLGAGYAAQRPQAEEVGYHNGFGESAAGPRQNVGATAWGAMSDNVHGTFSDNVWGTSADNVWGMSSSDVWGGVGGSPFGQGGKQVQIWGTGNGHNYLKGISTFLRKLFGIPNKKTVQAFQAHRQANPGVGRISGASIRNAAGSSRSSSGSSGSSRPAAPAPRRGR